MSLYLSKDTAFTNTANAIRDKLGTSLPLTWDTDDGFADDVDRIPTGSTPISLAQTSNVAISGTTFTTSTDVKYRTFYAEVNDTSTVTYTIIALLRPAILSGGFCGSFYVGTCDAVPAPRVATYDVKALWPNASSLTQYQVEGRVYGWTGELTNRAHKYIFFASSYNYTFGNWNANVRALII